VTQITEAASPSRHAVGAGAVADAVEPVRHDAGNGYIISYGLPLVEMIMEKNHMAGGEIITRWNITTTKPSQKVTAAPSSTGRLAAK